MNGACFRHIGGAVVADHGALTLVAARALSRFYLSEAGAAAGHCRQRAQSLDAAIAAATRWRRAAGWADPDLADQRTFIRAELSGEAAPIPALPRESGDPGFFVRQNPRTDPAMSG